MKIPEKIFCDQCMSELTPTNSADLGWTVKENTRFGFYTGYFCDRKCVIDFYSIKNSIKQPKKNE